MARPALPFFKMHGLGNDFVVIDDLPGDGALRPGPVTGPGGGPGGDGARSPIVRDDALRLAWPIDAALARALGHRQFGVGFDQLLWLRPSSVPSVDTRMEIFNPDGSIAEMCGNGVRAAARYLLELGPRPGRDHYAIETLGGLKKIQVHHSDSGETLFTVDMGAPRFGRGFEGGVEGDGARGALIRIEGLPEFRVFEVDMGNPHAVIFVDDLGLGDLAKIPAEVWGPALEKHPFFPRGANIEFTQILADGSLRVRVWERGAGLTLACGSGASAAAAAALQLGRTRAHLRNDGRDWVQVELPGGVLDLAWADGAVGTEPVSVFMRGPAAFSFQGLWNPH